MTSLISPDNTWALWAVITGWAAISIYLEQKYVWASTMSGAMLALLGAMILSNLRIIPTDSPTYDAVWAYVVPLAIPLLLFQCNIKKIWRESSRLLIIFLISSAGTVIGAIIGFYSLKNYVVDLDKVAGVMTGSYVGGTVNFVAMSQTLSMSGELASAAVVADNLLMALYFFVLISIPTTAIFRKLYKHPHIDEFEKKALSDSTKSSTSYWGRKEISLKDIAFAVASTFIIVTISTAIANFISKIIPTTNVFFSILNGIFGNKYLVITTISMVVATFGNRFFDNVKGTQEIGTFFIYLFFVVIGVPASIPLIISKSPLLLVFCAIVVFVNMLITFIFGKIFKFDLEEVILASNANIGGPTTAAAMAISKGWIQLVGPILIVGTFGYVLGNYLGVIVAMFLSGGKYL